MSTESQVWARSKHIGRVATLQYYLGRRVRLATGFKPLVSGWPSALRSANSTRSSGRIVVDSNNLTATCSGATFSNSLARPGYLPASTFGRKVRSYGYSFYSSGAVIQICATQLTRSAQTPDYLRRSQAWLDLASLVRPDENTDGALRLLLLDHNT